MGSIGSEIESEGRTDRGVVDAGQPIARALRLVVCGYDVGTSGISGIASDRDINRTHAHRERERDKQRVLSVRGDKYHSADGILDIVSSPLR